MTRNEPHTNATELHGGKSDDMNTEELLGEVAVEFFEQCAAGKPIDIEEYAEKHPAIAEHIRRTFPALKFVGDSTFTSDAIDLGKPIERTNEKLGDFRILKELGRGGMGVVYEAKQLSIGRSVALKVLPFATLADPRALARFKNEVRAAATLDHPNIVTVHSVGEERGIHYFAMQLIRGQSLAEVILELRKIRGESPSSDAGVSERTNSADGSMSCATIRDTRGFAELTTVVPTEGGGPFYQRVAELGEQAANALHFAHEQGVIHRDVKPANLMLDTAGKVYVTDFGLARIESDASLTMTGDLVGTLRYMAPEQAMGKRVAIDHRTDVYALGATLYELATLRPIFDGTDREALLRLVATEQPVAPGRIADDFPRDLETIICKALRKDREDRYDTAADLARDLRRWLDNKPIHGKRIGSLHVAQKWIRRNPTLVIGSLLGLLVLAGAMVLGAAQANANAERQRRLAYGPTLNTGYYEYAEGRLETVDRLLATTQPRAGQTDLRSFEWDLLKKLRDELRTDNRLTFNERIRSIRRSPGGRWLAVLTVNGQLTVVDLENNNRQTTLKAERLGSDYMRSAGPGLIAFSPDDRYLYSVAHGQVGPNNSPLLRFDLHRNIPVGIDFSGGTSQPDCYAVSVGPDGRVATLGWTPDPDGEIGDDGKPEPKWTCVTRDADTGDVLAMGNAGGMSLAYSPDGSMIAIAGGLTFTIQILDGNDLSKRYQMVVDGADKGSRIVSFSPDSQLLAGNSRMGVKIWDVSNDEGPKPVTELQTGWAWDIKFLNSDLVATSEENGRVAVRQLSDQGIVDQMKQKMPARALEFLKDADELVIGGTTELLFKPLRRTPTGQVKSAYMHAVGICQGTAALVTDENELLVWQPSETASDGVANIWEDLPPQQDRLASGVTDISIAPNGQTIAICQGEARNTISIWDRAGTFVTEIEGAYQAKFTPDGKHIVTSTELGVLALWDWRNRQRIATSPAAIVPNKSMAMEFSPTGAWLATGHGGALAPGAVCVWKVEGDAIQFIKKFDRRSGVEDLCFTRDEKWVVACDATGVEFHHLATGATRPLNSTGSVRGIDVTPDGKRLVTADGSNIRFWDVETGERMGSFDVGGFLTAVRFLDENRLLYIVRGVGARILDVTPE